MKNKYIIILFSSILLYGMNIAAEAMPMPHLAQPPVINIISINTDPICYNTQAQQLMGSDPGQPNVLFQWQQSTQSATAGFTDAAGGDIQIFNPGPLTVSTWFRRIATLNGVADTSNTVKATVLPATINLIINNPAPVCAPGTIDITSGAIVAGSSAGSTYSYFTNAQATLPVVTPTAISSVTQLNTTYYIKASNACTSAVKPVTIVINQPPDLNVTGSSVPVCKGQTVELYAHSPGNTTEWLGIGTGPTVTVRPQSTTTYVAKATSAAGCTRTAATELQVLEFSASLQMTSADVPAGTPVTLQASANRAFEVVRWLPASYFPNNNALTQTITVRDTTRTFSIIAVSEEGCQDTASTQVKFGVNTTDFFIPNAFTPNFDGKNDVFKVYGSSIKEVEIRIYTQWGEVIYETKDNGKGWDGTRKGVQQPVGVYIYAIKIKLDNEDSFIKKGSINLIR